MKSFQSFTRGVLLPLFTVLLFHTSLQAQQLTIDVRPTSGKYSFSYNEIPHPLVSYFAPPPGASFQWEFSTMPLSGFTIMTGETNASLTFSAPLTQTMYYRRKTFLGTSFYYSSVVKLQLVSVNWENLNYLRQHTVVIPGQNDWKVIDQLPIGSKLQVTSYHDGLGRTIETVSRETATPANPSDPNAIWGDMVQFAQYDGLARVPLDYLPYTTNSQPGKFKLAPITEQAQYHVNKFNENAPYQTKVYESSPLGKVLETRKAGSAWANAQRGNTISYEFNTASDQVKNFHVGFTPTDIPVNLGTYDAGSLYKLVSADEHNAHTIEFYNKAGQLILLKQQITKTNSISTIPAHNGWICTYNVYDDFGMLRAVIQPEAVKALDNTPGLNWSFTGVEGERLLNEMCFHYRYDAKGRVIYKKAPGAEALLMLYDSRDRVVMMQDGNQRIKTIPEWTVNLYDELDRGVITTLYYTNKTVAQLQADIDNAQDNFVTIHNIGGGGALTDLLLDTRDPSYGNYYAAQNSIEFRPGFESLPDDEFLAEIDPNSVTLPSSITMQVHAVPISQADLDNPSVCTILKYFYYDNYEFAGVKLFDTHFNNEAAYTNGEAIAPCERNWSMATGSSIRVLGTNQFLYSTIYYDEKGRPIQTLGDNIKQGTDITTQQYSFDDRLLSSETRHTALGTGITDFKILTKNVFDKLGRAISLEKKYGTNPFRQVSKYDLDDIGVLKIKHLAPQYNGIPGRSGLESLQYSYNIQGVITGINKDYALKTPGQYNKWTNFFGMYLGYEYVDDGIFDNGILSGQVSGILWNTQGDDAQRKYDFTYDVAGRLNNALFNERRKIDDSWTNTTMDFTVTGHQGVIEYDLNGNLKSMSHYGVLPGTASPVLVDDLRYTYQTFTNKLLKVTDEAANTGGIGSHNGKLGDFKDGGNATNTDDYVYDANGNLVIDLNKNIKDLVGVNGIRYNHLDKPEEIRIAGKGVVKLVYDANANKLQKQFIPESTGQPVTTTYIHEFVYKGADLQYINFEEGRIRVMEPVSENNGFDFLTIDGNIELPGGKKGSFDYFIMDYQSNVRMIITEETHIGSNLCTMETARDANEATVFGQVDANGVPTSSNEVRARYAKSGIASNAPYMSWTHPDIGDYVSRLGMNAGSTLGPNTLLKVMAGDKISASALYFFQPQGDYNNSAASVTPLINGLISAITGSNVADPLLKGSTAGIATTLAANSVTIGGISSPGPSLPTDLTPKAYLTLLFFDEQFRFIEESSTTRRVVQAGNHNDVLDILAVKAPRNGYAFVYVNNESDSHVYFDNLQVTHDRGRLVEENHYYAYGLKIAGISSHKVADSRQGHINNKNLYNDKELIDEEGLDWYDYGFRNYDPQIGRFVQIDPLTDYFTEFSPYQYANCDPITNVDIDGLFSFPTLKIIEAARASLEVFSKVKILSEVVVYTSKVSKPLSWLNKVTSKVGNFFVKAGKTVVSVGKGIVDGAVGAVKGTVQAITHPIQTLNGIVNAVVNYDQTWDGIKEGVSNVWQTIKSGDPEKIGYMLGKGVGNLAAGGAATKVLSTVGKLGAISKIVKKLPCGCFTAGTLVLTDSGYKRIEQLVVGDTVWAYNDKNGELTQKRVSNIFVFERDTVYQIKLGSEIIHATSDHPFFVGGKWVRVKHLRKGDSLYTYEKLPIQILGIELVIQPTKVYNFEVEDFHTYFVSRNNILVHNLPDPCDWPKKGDLTKNAAKGGFNFTKTAAAHMDEAGRMIPVQTLDDIIKAPMQVLKDPQGTNALMHYSQMWKNSKLYNVEVLYDKATNTIMHFKYTQKAIGPLQSIPK